ncbi:MAG: hypothetical protein QOK10_748 [Pseudonocardiales bacterium]|jgi:uncharacterized protein (TIGR02611 family)|nr:hypothetical protein [Pseudonocardiales bacterium]
MERRPDRAAEPIDSELPSFEIFAPSRPQWLNVIRDRALTLPAGAAAWKIGIALLGTLVVGVGLLLVPLPGPGWAVVFLGLAVWATEFYWAHRLLRFARLLLRRWTDWARRQSRRVQGLIGLVGLLFLAGVFYLVWQFLW